MKILWHIINDKFVCVSSFHVYIRGQQVYCTKKKLFSINCGDDFITDFICYKGYKPKNPLNITEIGNHCKALNQSAAIWPTFPKPNIAAMIKITHDIWFKYLTGKFFHKSFI